MSTAGPKVPPKRGGWDHNKVYFPLKLAGPALVSQQLVQYSDAVKDAKVDLLTSEDLVSNINGDLNAEAARNFGAKAAEFAKATENHLKEIDREHDEAAARAMTLDQHQNMQVARISTTSTPSSTSIYTATNNNPYTLGVGARSNPYTLHASSQQALYPNGYYPDQYGGYGF